MDRSSSCSIFRRLRLFVAAISLLPAIAQAVLFDLNITGKVTEINGGGLMTVFSVDDEMSATITYDGDAASQSSATPTQLLYPAAITGGSFIIAGSYSGAVTGGPISVSNDDPTFFDFYRFLGVANAPAVGVLDPELFGVLLEDPAAATLNSLDLPTATADVSGFPMQRWGLSFGSAIGTTPPGIEGVITSIEITERPQAVPEPSTLLLVFPGLLLFAMGRSRRTDPADA